MTATAPSGTICTRTSREARTVTAIHLPTDPVPALPAMAPPRPRLLERLLRWIDDGLVELGSDD